MFCTTKYIPFSTTFFVERCITSRALPRRTQNMKACSLIGLLHWFQRIAYSWTSSVMSAVVNCIASFRLFVFPLNGSRARSKLDEFTKGVHKTTKWGSLAESGHFKKLKGWESQDDQWFASLPKPVFTFSVLLLYFSITEEFPAKLIPSASYFNTVNSLLTSQLSGNSMSDSSSKHCIKDRNLLIWSIPQASASSHQHRVKVTVRHCSTDGITITGIASKSSVGFNY